MKRRDRTQSIFSLSALDVLATAMGAFVLLVVVLMPYYRMNFEARAEIQETQAAAEQSEAEALNQRKITAKYAAAAAKALAEAETLAKKAGEARAAAASLRQEADAADGRAGRDARLISQMKEIMDKKVIKELDLIFVMDATASMTEALQDLALSLSGIVRILERLVPSLRIGFVAYRDYDIPGSWTTKPLPLLYTSRNLQDILNFAKSLRVARPGATVEEAVFRGLRRALGMNLRPSAKQTVIVIGDARAHLSNEMQALDLARRFTQSGPRRSVSTTYVETTPSRLYGQGDRDFFIRLARAGGGSYSGHRGQLTENILLSILGD